MVVRAFLMPDAAAGHFYRAQRLESAGQEQQALRLFQLIVETQPNSAFAPRALQQEGEILTAMARRDGDAKLFRQAIDAYASLATNYSSHSSAGEALLAAGSIAWNDLRDGKVAGRYYKQLLQAYPGNSEYASEATLRLGRIALQAGDNVLALKMFSRVLKDYSRFPERCAEAQYHQGITLETLLNNKSAARDCYEKTIKKWPNSVWASDAKERLGLMTYSTGGVRAARRVMLEVGSLPRINGDSRSAALRLILAARGMEISDVIWRGWSLAPFRAGFVPENPGKVVGVEEDWETVAANAGISTFYRKEGSAAEGKEKLLNELDAGHLSLVYLGDWMVITGYDSSRDEIFAHKPGADVETYSGKEFISQWKRGGDYTFLAFQVSRERLRPSVERQAASPDAPPLLAPYYVYHLPELSEKDGHRRALRQAALAMNKSREGGALLNIEALRALQRELENLSHPPAESPVPAAEAKKDETASADPAAEATPAPATTPVPAPTPKATSAQRWKNLRHWFGAPLKSWVESRRDAAAFLDITATDLGNSNLQSAAEHFRESMNILEAAGRAAPAEDIFATDPEAARQAMQSLAEQIGQALEAEKQATAAMKV